MEGFIWWHHLVLVTVEGIKLEDTWVMKAAVNSLEQWARLRLSISAIVQQTSSQAPPSSGYTLPLVCISCMVSVTCILESRLGRKNGSPW